MHPLKCYAIKLGCLAHELLDVRACIRPLRVRYPPLSGLDEA